MTESLRGRAAIVGIGNTEVGSVPSMSSAALYVDAGRRAIGDSGLEKSDIDGLITFNSMAEPIPMFHAEVIAEMLGLKPSYLLTGSVGGAQPIAAVHHAAAAVAFGVCRNVLTICADNLLTGISRWHNNDMSHRTIESAQFELPYGMTAPASYALYARAHMARYGTTAEQFAAVSVVCRRHASLNPAAQMRDPITLDDVLASRPIADPLRLLNCSLVSDGGAAWIITSAERVSGTRPKPVYVLGAGEANWHNYFSHVNDFTETPARDSGARAYEMAGLGPSDVDVAELYDCFSPMVILQLEDLGFCEKGEGGSFVESGNIELGGALPIITHGGLLSHAHPGYPGSSFNLTEAVTQLRGEAGERQVAGAEVALVQGQGGTSSTHATVLLGSSR